MSPKETLNPTTLTPDQAIKVAAYIRQIAEICPEAKSAGEPEDQLFRIALAASTVTAYCPTVVLACRATDSANCLMIAAEATIEWLANRDSHLKSILDGNDTIPDGTGSIN